MKIKLVLVFLIGLGSLCGYAQSKYEQRLLKKHNRFLYYQTSETFSTAISKGKASSNASNLQVADAHYTLSNYKDAAEWYSRVFQVLPRQEPKILYRYAQSLRSINKHTKADSLTQVYNHLTGANIPFNFLDELNNQEPLFDQVRLHGKNEFEVYYISDLNQDEQLFVSMLEHKKQDNNKPLGRSQTYILGEDGNNLTRYPAKKSTKLNDVVFTKDGLTMYYSLNVRKKHKDSNVIQYAIFKATRTNRGWSKGELLEFSSLKNVSYGHPALSPDERYLYFSSDKPGGYGEFDLYRVEIIGQNSFGTPQNLGPQINTPTNDGFPFLTQNKLYFSSQGHQNFGGLDIFSASIDGDSFFQAQNVGKPINSNQDDFAFILFDNEEKGFFSSRRDDKKDRLFSFSVAKCLKEWTIVLTDANTKEAIPHAKIMFKSSKGDLIKQSSTDSLGYVSFKTPCEKSSFEQVDVFYEDEMLGSIQLDSENQTLFLSIKRYQEGQDLIKKLEMQGHAATLFFKHNSSFLTKNAEKILELVTEILFQNPQMHLLIRSHTDIRGTPQYNQWLSERRAQSIYNKLIANGIQSFRMQKEAFGEKEPIHLCDPCSEEQHLVNRRSELIITRVEDTTKN